MPGMRTHAEWSQRMLSEYQSETEKMLPGFANLFTSEAGRGALYWASNTPDWYNTAKYSDELAGYIGKVQKALADADNSVNNALDTARQSVNGAIGSVIKDVNGIIRHIPLVKLPTIPEVPQIPQLPRIPLFGSYIDKLAALKAEAERISPGPDDFAHWVPFCREYAKYLQSHGADVGAQAFFLGVVSHVMEDIPFHFDGPEWPAQGYGNGVYMVDRVQDDPAQGQRPVMLYMERRLQPLGLGESRIDEYLVGASPQNSTIHKSIVASWGDLSKRLKELQAVYRQIGVSPEKTSMLERCTQIQQAIWEIEQEFAKDVGSFVNGVNGVVDSYQSALRQVVSKINGILDDVSKLPVVPNLPHVPQPPSIPRLTNPLDLSSAEQALFSHYFYAGLENAAAFTATGIQGMYAYLKGWQFYRNDLGCTDYRLRYTSPIRKVPEIEYPQYGGVTQTHISQHDPNNNAGHEPFLLLRDGAENRIHGLLRFELANNDDPSRNIGSGAVVEQAMLWLYLADRSVPHSSKTIALYKINTPWNAGSRQTDVVSGTAGALAAADEATWLEPKQGQRKPWQKPGCDGAPADRDEKPAAKATVPSTGGQWMSFDVTALVQQWVNHPDQNQGVLLRPTNEDKSSAEVLRFYSSQAYSGSPGELGGGDRIARRPTLVVRLKQVDRRAN